MGSQSNPIDPRRDAASTNAARSQLDRSIAGYNRHALLSEQFRRSVERFRQAQATFEAIRAEFEEKRQEVLTRRAAIAAQVTLWRAARAGAAHHRAGVELSVREYVRCLRDEGMAPERMLLDVKHRLAVAVTPTTPDAPTIEARQLSDDVSAWAIDAYYAAA
jgi:hypothetical protein